jgi:hypothetical protein
MRADTGPAAKHAIGSTPSASIVAEPAVPMSQMNSPARIAGPGA